MDALANDGHAALAVLEGLELEAAVSQAGELLATLLGQDLDTCEDGVFRIARRVAKDRIISTVDPEARHGHKTATRGFDGYKGHVAIDPDSEIITATVVTAGNTGDAASAAGLLAEELATPAAPEGSEVKDAGPAVAEKDTGEGHASPAIEAGEGLEAGGTGDPAALAVYEDAAYGAGALLVELEAAGATVMVKVQPPVAPGGRYTKGCFIIDTGAGTVTCPAKVTVPIRVAKDGGCTAAFGAVCTACLSAGRAVHGFQSRANRHCQPVRGRACPGQGNTEGPGLQPGVPGRPTESRTQNRAPHATQARRTAG